MDSLSATYFRVLSSGCVTRPALVLGVLGFAWHAVRAPILLFLILLEPFVRLVLGGAALLGVLTAFLFEASAVPNFPFWFQISMSFGCLAVLALYYGLIRLLS